MKVKQIQIFNLPNSPLDAGMKTRVMSKNLPSFLNNENRERSQQILLLGMDLLSFFL